MGSIRWEPGEERLRHTMVGVVQSPEDRHRSHLNRRAAVRRWHHGRLGEPLAQALMRALPVEVSGVRLEGAHEMPVPEDDQVVQALPAHAPKEALADGIGKQCRMHSMHLTRRKCSGLPTPIIR